MAVLAQPGDSVSATAEPSARGAWSTTTLLDAALAACIAAWGVGAIRQGSAVSFGIAALHFTVAGLVLFRVPEQERAPLAGLVMSLPAVAVGAIVLEFAPHPSSWPPVVQGIFLLSVGTAIVSLIALGRSFAILPSRRSLVTRQVYRVVRHPIYAAELSMVCVGAGTLDVWWGLPLALSAILAVALRIGVEERLWAADPQYQAYKQRVPWKLLPGVW